MARIVMKFGGTSVADLTRIRHVASLVAAEAKAGNEIAVVVSAMSGETNRLVALVDELSADSDLGGGCLLYTSPSPRDRTRSRMPSSA